MTGYILFLIVLWLGIFAMLIAAVVVLLALFGGGAAVCLACRRLTGLKQRNQREAHGEAKSDEQKPN